MGQLKYSVLVAEGIDSNVDRVVDIHILAFEFPCTQHSTSISFFMSRRRFQDKVVFVTGGASGLGAATSQLFVDEGATVVVADLEERGILKTLGSSASYEKCDVSSPESCESALNSCIATHGRLDVLFHNAACLAPVASAIDHDLATFQRVINTNLCSLFYLARVALPQMKRQGKGSIVVTGSTSGIAADFGLCAYNAAKAGIMNLARTLAIDHIRDGIRVNIVAPGHMVTPMTIGFYDHSEAKAELLEGIPLGRGCDPKEVGAAVLFLASDEAYSMTGHSKRTPQALIRKG